MGLDYGHTCGEIDSHIDDFKTVLDGFLDDFIDEICPLIEGKQRLALIKTYIDSIYTESEVIFEGVRKCNEDMRQEADRQIEEAEEKVAEVEEEKQARIDELEYDLKILEDRCAELEDENEELLKGAI